jgi:hypothetical protein
MVRQEFVDPVERVRYVGSLLVVDHREAAIHVRVVESDAAPPGPEGQALQRGKQDETRSGGTEEGPTGQAGGVRMCATSMVVHQYPRRGDRRVA